MPAGACVQWPAVTTVARTPGSIVPFVRVSNSDTSHAGVWSVRILIYKKWGYSVVQPRDMKHISQKWRRLFRCIFAPDGVDCDKRRWLPARIEIGLYPFIFLSWCSDQYIWLRTVHVVNLVQANVFVSFFHHDSIRLLITRPVQHLGDSNGEFEVPSKILF